MPRRKQVGIERRSTNRRFECQFADGYWSGIYGRGSNEVDGLKLYKVYSTPSTPQAPPWDGVLQDSCTWAAGKSTAADVARYLTTGLYFSQRFSYPQSTGSAWTDPNDPTRTTFLLTRFLNTSGYQPGNCMDVSDYLCICAHAQGLDFTVAQHDSNPGDVNGQFDTNPICPIGDDPTLEAYAPTTWAWHQFCLYGNVYDACAAQKYDLSGAEFRNPPFAWGVSGYWQTNTPRPDNPIYCLGLVNSPRPTSPHQFSDYVPSVL